MPRGSNAFVAAFCVCVLAAQTGSQEPGSEAPVNAPGAQIPPWSTRLQPVGPYNPVRVDTATGGAGSSHANAQGDTCQNGGATVQVKGTELTEWPCCGCNQPSVFFSTVQSGSRGTYKMLRIDRSQNSREWFGPFHVNAVQRVELSAVPEASERLTWGEAPISFVVEGELVLTGLHILGDITLLPAGRQLQLSNVMCAGDVVSESSVGQLTITDAQLLARLVFAGSALVKRSDLVAVTDFVFGNIAVVHVTDSTVSKWPQWNAALLEQNATLVTECVDSLGTDVCLGKLAQGLECATSFCPQESCMCKPHGHRILRRW
eukprot:COSAG05_NODE_2447_length_3056_cov_1.630707_5_plen_318_part_00